MKIYIKPQETTPSILIVQMYGLLLHYSKRNMNFNIYLTIGMLL
jgi:hypothetical protein